MITREEAVNAVKLCATKRPFVFGAGSMAKVGQSLFMWSNGAPMIVYHGGCVEKFIGCIERGYTKGFNIQSITG